MKLNRSTWVAFGLLIIAAALSRILTLNIAGFAPQVAMALFGGAVIKDKKWAFALPLFSLLLSDVVMELLYRNAVTDRAGFYEGQWQVYLCFALITVFGFLLKKINFKNVIIFSISGSLIFFIVSNFLVWNGGGGLGRPHTIDGLLLCYGDAIAYYRDYGLIKGFVGNPIIGDLAWSLVLFLSYQLITRPSLEFKKVRA
jgi:hypothetical protein